MKMTSTLPNRIMINSLRSSGFPLTASNYYKIRTVAYKLAKKYHLLGMYDDVLQLILIASTQKEKKFSKDKGAYSTFIYVISERMIINHFIRTSKTFAIGKKIQKYVKEVKRETGEPPNVAQIAKQFGITEDEVLATYLYHTDATNYRLFSDASPAEEDDDFMFISAEMDELFSDGFKKLTDLQRALVDEVVIQDEPLYLAAVKFGVTEDTAEKQFEEAMNILKEYI